MKSVADEQKSSMDDFYSLRTGALWRHFASEKFSFWMICGYLFIEYVRPQSIIPALDVLPWARTFLLLAMAGWLLDKQRRWVRDPANVWMTLFLTVILLSCLVAEFPEISWSHWFDFVGWYVIYFLLINIVNSEKRFFILLAIFLLASFKLSFFGARTWAMRGFSFTSWGLMGPPGHFQNSGELSIQMLMFSPIAYHVALFLRPWLSRTRYLLLMFFPVTGALTVMGAGSRGAQLGMVYQLYRSLLKGKLSIKALLLVGIVASVGYTLLPDEQKARFSSAGDDRTSQQRLLYWTHGVDMIKEFPVLGVGFYNFAPYYERHYPEDMLYGAAQLPHNIFVQVGTDTGILGLVIFMGILYRSFKCCREIRAISARAGPAETFASSVATGLTIALWGFIIAGQFVTVTYYPFLWINLALTVSLLNIVKQQAGQDQRAHQRHSTEKRLGAASIERVPRPMA